MKKVSIIVPVYNVELYLADCLNSLINQTYSNIEIILINDGSKDNSGIICEKFAEKDSRINYIKKENSGVSDTRNIALEKSTGEYILFVDSDDWIDCDCVEKLMDNIEDNDILQFNCVREYENKSESKKIHFENGNCKIINMLINDVIIPEKMMKKDQYLGETRAIWSKIYKKDCIKDAKFNKNMKFYEDGDFVLQILSNGDIKCKIVDLPMYHYRINQSSCTKKYRQNIKEETIKVIESLNETLNKINNKHLVDYVVLDMFCFNINNLIRKKDFTYNEIKELCENDLWKLRKLKINTSYYKLGRKLLYFFAKHKFIFGVWILCKLKGGN